MFYLILYSVFYLPWLSHVSYIQHLCYNILIHINIIMATCKQSRFDITGLKLHHTSFVLSAQVIFCKWLLLLLFKPDGLYVWLIIKKTSNIHVFMASVLVLNAIDRGFEPRSGNPKDYVFCSCDFMHWIHHLLLTPLSTVDR